MRRLIRFFLLPIKRRVGHALDVRFRDSEERIFQRLHGLSPAESRGGPPSEALIYLGRQLRALREELQEQRDWLEANTPLKSKLTDVTDSETSSPSLSPGVKALIEAFELSMTAHLERGSRVLFLGHLNTNFSAALALIECKADFQRPSPSAKSRPGRPEDPGSITETDETPQYDAIFVTEDALRRHLEAEILPSKVEAPDGLVRSCISRLRFAGLLVISSPMNSPIWTSVSTLMNPWITVDSCVIPITNATPSLSRSSAASPVSPFIGRSDLYGLVALRCREKGGGRQ